MKKNAENMKRLSALLVSMVTCLSMASPAMAADFDDLQAAIDGNLDQSAEGETGTQLDESEPVNGTAIDGEEGTYGYGWNGANQESESKGWDIWAWVEEGLEGIRNLKLFGDVTQNEDNDSSDISTVAIGREDGKINLDLNGKNIEGTSSAAVIEVKDGGDLTLNDKSEEKTGSITGGQTGVVVENGGTFTMDGGNITGNTNNAKLTGDGKGGGVVVNEGGTFTMNDGSISNNVVYGKDNDNHGQGSGVYNDGTFTMNGGTISNNTADYYGEGGGVYNNGSFYMNDGSISKNNADWEGGGVYSTDTFIMNGGEVSDNQAINNGGGGGIWTTGKFKDDVDADGNKQGGFVMNGGVISGNVSNGREGGGIHINGDAEINRGVIVNNTTTTKGSLGGGGIYVNGSGGTLTMSNAIITQNQAYLMGGGIAACYTGECSIYATDGAAIFGNKNLIDSNGNSIPWSVALENFLKNNPEGLKAIDGYYQWSQLSPEEKEKFIKAAMDIFIAGHGSGGEIKLGMLMLGSSLENPEELTDKDIAAIQKILNKWQGKALKAEDNSLIDIDKTAGIINSKYLAALKNNLDPVEDEDSIDAALRALCTEYTGECSEDLLASLKTFLGNLTDQAALQAISENITGVLIAGNKSTYTYGGGIANNGILTIGKEEFQAGEAPKVEAEKNLMYNDGKTDAPLTGGEFHFELQDENGTPVRDKGKAIIVTNDADGKISFPIPFDVLANAKFENNVATVSFLLSEVDEEQDGITYDTTKYKVTVKLIRGYTTQTIGGTNVKINYIKVDGDVKYEKLVKDDEGNPVWEAVEGEVAFNNTTNTTPPEEPTTPEEPTPEEPDEPTPPEEPTEPEEPYTPPYNPPEEVPENPTPLTPTPEEVVPETPVEEIADEQTPLAPAISEEEIVEIPEEVTPLASVPKTGAVEGIAAIPAAIAAAVAMLLKRKRREE